jgi:hypothetical protein
MGLAGGGQSFLASIKMTTGAPMMERMALRGRMLLGIN